MPYASREIRLLRRIHGQPEESDFGLTEVSIPDPSDGEFVVRNVFVAVDPFLRLYMGGPRRNAVLYPVDAPPPALAVGQVVASASASFPEGSWVTGPFGWRELALSDGSAVRSFDPRLGSPSLALGPLGMPGITAWAGTKFVAEPVAGETIYVSAAAGAVGSLVGQIAKLRGATVIGSAGHPEKLAWLQELGFDVSMDYRRGGLEAALRAAAPEGLDVAFDNVGGAQLEAAIGAMREFGRIVCCGSISLYNEAEAPGAPDNLHLIFVKSLRIQGFRWRDHIDRLDEFYRDMGGWLAEGRIQHRDHIVHGIENVPAAFIDSFHSPIVGKALVRPDSTNPNEGLMQFRDVTKGARDEYRGRSKPSSHAAHRIGGSLRDHESESSVLPSARRRALG